jgi:hypothetical protein
VSAIGFARVDARFVAGCGRLAIGVQLHGSRDKRTVPPRTRLEVLEILYRHEGCSAPTSAADDRREAVRSVRVVALEGASALATSAWSCLYRNCVANVNCIVDV